MQTIDTRHRLKTGALALGIVAAVGCSAADEHPLGGPYGGSSSDTRAPASVDGNEPAGSESPGGSSTDAGKGSNRDGGTTDAGSAADAAKTDAGSGASGPPAAPTWTAIYTSYFASRTIGNCAHCHSGMSTPSGAYTYLTNKGYISGASSPLIDKQVSCLSWYGGSMPPNGPTSLAQASADLDAWAKAGAARN